jgi:putative ATP-dependent endonuclease of the OLD family
VENFRGFKKLTLDFNRTTVLIGENNSGKSSILEAVHLALGRGMSRRSSPFSDFDHHLATADAEPANAPQMVLTFTFREQAKDEWPDEVVQALEKAIQVRADGLQEVVFQARSRYDKSTNGFVSEWAFLDLSGNALPAAKNPRMLADLQQLNPVFLLAAVRDADDHFHAKSAFWGPFQRNLKMDETTRASLEEQIEKINQTVLDAHAPFEEVKERIAQAAKLLPLGSTDTVGVEAVPARVFDMLTRTQVKLACRTGAKLPVGQHGAGTQSLAVLFLFEAFLNARLADAYDKHSEPLLVLEEPEAHLHPSAIRSLWSMLDALKGQKVIASHSGDLLAAVPLKSVRRLARRDGETKVFRLGDSTLNAVDERKIGYHVRAKRGQLLFARCWLLVEGESEFWMLPEAAKLCGYDLELEGVCCVEFAQCGIESLIKVAKDFGIEWYCLADGDPEGVKYASEAKKHLGKDAPADRVTNLAERDLEHAMWKTGYSAVYETHVSAARRKLITEAPGTPEYVAKVISFAIRSTSKPFLCTAVMEEAAKPKSPGLPSGVKTAIETAVKWARRCA